MSGRIALACALRDGRSRMTEVRYEGLARASRARRDGDAAHLVLAHLGPGVLGGDVYDTRASIERDAALTITGQMATPVYARAAPSVTHATWTLAPGATLVVRPEPLMLDAGARHDANATIDVAPGACAIVTDLVTVGPGALARMRTIARIGGRLVARDACDLGAQVVAVATVLLVCDDDARRAASADAAHAVLARTTGARGGVGATPGALLVRATSDRVWPLVQLVDALVSALRRPLQPVG